MIDRTDPAADSLARAVAGQYRLEKEIGRGGMGIVYLATDEQLERRVAIKTLPPHLSSDAGVRARFIREARTAGALSHPGIVPIYSAAERDGVVYFVMRWIDGESVAERLQRQGPMSSEAVLALVAELTHALGYAHAQGVVHRDIKPENVLVERSSGRAVITDFGIARVAETQPMTATGTVLGTVQYMSPEQVTGDEIDGRTDLYALGVLAFHALSGRHPFERAMPSAVLVAHVNSPPPRIRELVPGVSPRLDRIIARLLEKQPAARFASAEALRNAIEGTDDDAGGLLQPMLVAPAARPPVVRRGGLALAPAGEPEPEAQRLSTSDAQRVWARAAELQANTGLAMTPPDFRVPDPTREAATRGYDVALIRESAVEAGIDARYVARALEERALVERSASLPALATPGEVMQRTANIFVGSRTRLEYQGSIEGELRPDGFEEIADEVRRMLGEMVTVSAVGRTLTITTASSGGGRKSVTPRFLQVTVSSRNGRTQVHAFENLQQLAGATFGGMMGGLGMGGGGMMMGGVMGATQNPAIAFPVWATMIVASYAGARLLLRRSSRKREAELKRIVEHVLVRARELVG
jgi:eukaryotic-like serine/threonine-protein kinase